MVPEKHAQPIGERREFLESAYPRVEELSGVKFGDKYFERLKEGTTVYSSDMPSKVFHVLAQRDDRHPLIAKSIQHLIYSKGIDPGEISAYGGVANEFGINRETMGAEVLRDEITNRYEEDIYTTRQFGVRGFPFAVVNLEGEFYLLAQGFRIAEDLEHNLHSAIRYHTDRSV